MLTPILKTATNRCTKWCTEVWQLALTTLFLDEQMHRMPLKMLAVENGHWTVAPNVAGSIPVSHPKALLTFCFASPFRKRQVRGR